MTPWAFALLALAAWRTWALIARDSILDAPRDRWFPEGSIQRGFIECPYCLGFWTSGCWVTAYDVSVDPIPGVVAWQAGWWACSAAVVAIELVLDRLSGE